jgi:hypothetical protein
LQCEKVGF